MSLLVMLKNGIFSNLRNLHLKFQQLENNVLN